MIKHVLYNKFPMHRFNFNYFTMKNDCAYSQFYYDQTTKLLKIESWYYMASTEYIIGV